MRYLLPGLLLCAFCTSARGEDPASEGARPELGKVTWIRDHDAGLARAKAAKKPVFLLFQEVPG